MKLYAYCSRFLSDRGSFEQRTCYLLPKTVESSFQPHLPPPGTFIYKSSSLDTHPTLPHNPNAIKLTLPNLIITANLTLRQIRHNPSSAGGSRDTCPGRYRSQDQIDKKPSMFRRADSIGECTAQALTSAKTARCQGKGVGVRVVGTQDPVGPVTDHLRYDTVII